MGITVYDREIETGRAVCINVAALSCLRFTKRVECLGTFFEDVVRRVDWLRNRVDYKRVSPG